MYKAQSVVINDVIYVGGGIVNKGDVPCLIFKYNPKYDLWTTLPCCPVTNFGLTIVDSKPVLIGGRDIHFGGRPTSHCFVFEAKTDEWKKSIPAMSIARHSVTCGTNESHVIACGGIRDVNEIEDVEIFQIAASQWYTATKMPFSGAMMSNQIINNTLYIASFDKSIACSSLDDLDFAKHEVFVKHTDFESSESPDDEAVDIYLKWTHLKTPSLTIGSLINFKSSLACVGGITKTNYKYGRQTKQYSNDIYLYSPFTSDWVVFATLNKTCCYPTIATLSNGDILVLGGCNGDNEEAFDDVVELAIMKH